MKPIIRPLKRTIEDFASLAACHNEFRSSPGSWPAGFGAGAFTAAALMDDYKSLGINGHFVAEVEALPGVIVGVCNIGKSWHRQESWYVQLLGVVSAYQGRKYGRELLKTAVAFAVERRARVLELHTWPGNIKAMPLYKRIGYLWRPGTAVFMENFAAHPGLRRFFRAQRLVRIFPPRGGPARERRNGRPYGDVPL
jgi:GNAT superfamily N-acetyltransferase